MSIPIQLFENFIVNNASTPDIYNYSYNKFSEPNDNFVISRNFHGEILSVYADNIWDLTPYAPSLTQTYKIHFYKDLKNKKNIFELKKLFFLIMVIGSPFKSQTYSVTTLTVNYKILSHLAQFAEYKNKTFYEILSDNKYLKEFISNYTHRKRYLGRLIPLLLFLDKMDNNLTGIHFKKDEKLLNYLKKIVYNEIKYNKQTEIIPSKIFTESIKERWIQIKEIEQNLGNIASFILNVINSKYFAASKKFQSLEYKRHKDFIEWEPSVGKYKLTKLFKKYNVTNKFKLKKFVRQIQGTCNHLIHAYTGMRLSEVLSLKINCLRKLDDENKVRIIGTTTKFESGKKSVEWVTTYEIEKVINILDKISEVLSTKIYFPKKNDRYLFISTTNLSSTISKKTKIVSTSYKSDECLALNNKLIKIDENAIKELENLEYDRDWRNEKNFQIGTPWIFKTHQYRRSLAVYSIQSGIVSLATIKYQFKHLFREMSYYYQNNSINAKNIISITGNHISKEINRIRPEIDAISYIENVLNSDENIFGNHGKIINSIYKHDENSVIQNKKIIMKFKNTELGWKETALGGCVKVDPCDSRLLRNLTECIDCNHAVHKESKLKNAIFHLERFIETLEPNSIEYNTEIKDLEILKSYLKRINEKGKI